MDTLIDSIDLSALFGGSAADEAACDSALWAGLARTGSVVITGFPGAGRIDGWARTAMAFFDLDDEALRQVTTRLEVPGNATWYRGYHPCTPERLLANDIYDIGPRAPVPGPDLPGMALLTEPTPWPDPEPVPGWRDAVGDLYATLNTVAQAMIRSIGRSAGFTGEAIAERFAGEHSTLRLLSYAAGARTPHQGAGDPVLSAARHTDASGLSLLWQSGPGLQAEGGDGAWRDVPLAANAISVHVGDVMTGLTRGRVPATPHRVLGGQGARQSLGFFLEPALSAPVTPADVPVAETGIADTYGWQLLRTLARRKVWAGVVPDPEAPVA